MPRLSISRAITWLAAQDPDAVAVQDDAQHLTRSELDRLSNRLARGYAALGVVADDLVTVTLPNSVEFVVACVAIWKLGATPQPLSYRLPLEERRAVVDLAGSRLVVGAEADDYPGVTVVPRGFASEEGDGQLPDASASSWKAPTSSGSTGHPKIVMASAGATIDPESRVAEFIPHRATQLVVGPLYHSAPFTYAMRGLMTGHRLVVLPKFDPERVLEAVDEHRITWMMLVPTMMKRISDLPREVRDLASWDSLESVIHLGAPCDPQLKRQWIDWLGPERVNEVYVGSESAGITMITGTEWLDHEGSVGRPIGGSRMRIVDDDGAEVAPGVTGRVEMTRSGGPTYRYLGRPARDLEWDTLGDIGRMDADGYLWVVDRADDLIITGGVNVYPVEIERVLERHPRVRSAVAFGVPDDERGHVVVARVDVASHPITADELFGWLRGRLDPEKLPRMIDIVHEPVRDDAGKVRRRMLATETVALNTGSLD